MPAPNRKVALQLGAVIALVFIAIVVALNRSPAKTPVSTGPGAVIGSGTLSTGPTDTSSTPGGQSPSSGPTSFAPTGTDKTGSGTSAPPITVLTGAAAAAMPATATKFLQAYYDRSYTDSSENAWIAKSEPFVTGSYNETLQSHFNNGPPSGSWTDFVASKQTVILVCKPGRPETQAGSTFVIVPYIVKTLDSTGKTIDSTPGNDTVIFAEIGGKWLVDDDEPTVSGDPGSKP